MSWFITKDYLRSLLDYDVDTGSLTWRARTDSNPASVRAFNAAYMGKEAGETLEDGRVTVMIDGKPYYASGLIVMYMTGAWPSTTVVHKNGNRSDNKWTNLKHQIIECTYNQG